MTVLRRRGASSADCKQPLEGLLQRCAPRVHHLPGKADGASTSKADSWRSIGYMAGGHRSAAWIASTRGMPALLCYAGGRDGSPRALRYAAAEYLCHRPRRLAGFQTSMPAARWLTSARMRAGSGSRKRAAGPDVASCVSEDARHGERLRCIRCRHGWPCWSGDASQKTIQPVAIEARCGLIGSAPKTAAMRVVRGDRCRLHDVP